LALSACSQVAGEGRGSGADSANGEQAGSCVAHPEEAAKTRPQNRSKSYGGAEAKRFLTTAEDAFEETGSPGAVVGISSARGTWVASFGTAEVDAPGGAGASMGRETHTRIGSITKTFTGTIAIQLDEQGVLSLDDPLERYWPGIANGDRITLRNLANMSSGIASYTKQDAFQTALFSNPQRSFTSADLVAYVDAEPALFEPGQGFDYSNTNTILLASAIEQASGKSIAELIADQISGPLGLKQTVWPKAATDLPSPYARGLTNQGLEPGDERTGQETTFWNPSWAGAAGSLVSTVDDLLTYGHALATGQGLLKPEVAAERLRSFPAGEQIGYGLGFACYGGWVGHEGSLPGYNTQMAFDTVSGTTVAVAVNSDIRVGDCEAGEGTEKSGLADERCLTPASRILIALSELVGNEYTPPGS